MLRRSRRPPPGSPPRPPVPPHHDQPEVSAHLLSLRLSHGWVHVSIERGGLTAAAPGASRYRHPIREYMEPGVSGLCVLVTLSCWFGSTENVRDSAQRDPRNLCPPLRMISLRRQGPGERIDQRPRWVSGIGQGRLSPGWEIPSAETGCSVQATPFPPPCTCGCRLTTWRQSGCNVAEHVCGASIIDMTFMCKTPTQPACIEPEPGVGDQLIHLLSSKAPEALHSSSWK